MWKVSFQCVLKKFMFDFASILQFILNIFTGKDHYIAFREFMKDTLTRSYVPLFHTWESKYD